MSARLSKEERISSQKAIGQLVAGGRYLVSGPLRCCYLVRKEEPVADGEESATDRGPGNLNRILVTVPKKFFKRAVKRNLFKRRIREAYRLQKDLLEPRGIDMMFIFNSKEIVSYDDVSAAVRSALATINSRTAK